MRNIAFLLYFVHFIVAKFKFLVFPDFSLVSPRGRQADELLDKVVDDELNGHNHADVQQTRALRGERVRGKEGEMEGK